MLRQEQKEFKDITVYAGNPKGRIYLIGDTHGCPEAVKAALKKIGELDWLVVGGDLFDRGPNSWGVYKEIAEANKDRAEPKVFVARGNHETLFLKYYDAFIAYEKNPTPENKAELELRRQRCITNGGNWLTVLETEPRDSEKRRELDEIANYLRFLPYISCYEKTERANAFSVVHAALPFTISKLKEKMAAGKFSLSAAEKRHATDARPKKGSKWPLHYEFSASDRRIYGGHTICDGVRLNQFFYNLDVGTSDTGCVCLVDHEREIVELLTVEYGKGRQPNPKLRCKSGKTPEDVKEEIETGFCLEKIWQAAELYVQQTSEHASAEQLHDKIRAMSNLILVFRATDSLHREQKTKINQTLSEAIAVMTARADAKLESVSDPFAQQFLQAIAERGVAAKEVKLDQGRTLRLYPNFGFWFTDTKGAFLDWGKLSEDEGFRLLAQACAELPLEGMSQLYGYRKYIQSVADVDKLFSHLSQLPDSSRRIEQAIKDFLTPAHLASLLKTPTDLNNLFKLVPINHWPAILAACDQKELTKILNEMLKEPGGFKNVKKICDIYNNTRFLNAAVAAHQDEIAAVIMLSMQVSTSDEIDEEIDEIFEENAVDLADGFIEVMQVMDERDRINYVEQICSQENVFGICLKDEPDLLDRIKVAAHYDEKSVLKLFLNNAREKYQSLSESKEMQADRIKYLAFLEKFVAEIYGFFGSRADLIAAFAKNLKYIDRLPASFSEKLQELRVYIIDNYCNLRMVNTGETQCEMFRKILEYDGMEFKQEVTGPVSLARYHKDYKFFDFRSACDEIEACLSRLNPFCKFPSEEFKAIQDPDSKKLLAEENQFYQDKFNKLLLIAVQQYLEFKPSRPGLFHGQQAKKREAACKEILALLNEYFVVINPQITSAPTKILNIEDILVPKSDQTAKLMRPPGS